MSLVVRLVLSVVLALTLAVMQATGSDAAFSWITGPTIPEVEVNRAAQWRSTTVRNATDVDLVMRYSSTAGTPADTWQQLKVKRNGQRIFTGGAVGSTLVAPSKLTAAATGARVGRATLGATRLAGGPIMIAWLGGELLWAGYKELNPPPDWDWETGDDPQLDEGSVSSGGVVVVLSPDLPDGHSIELHALAVAETFTTLDYDELGIRGGYDNDGVPSPGSMTFDGWRAVTTTDLGMPMGGGAGGGGCGSLQPAGWVEPRCSNLYDQDVWVARGGRSHWIPERWYYVIDTGPEVSVPLEGRVVYEYDCLNNATGSTSSFTHSSDWYDDHKDRPDLNPFACVGADQELVDICVYRELSDGSRRSILGCGADGQGGVGISTDGGSTTASIVTAPSPSRPSEWPTELEQPGADDLYDDLERSDGRLVLVDLVQGLEATPSTHQGWWTYPDAQTRFECRWYGLSSGEYVVLDLERCSEMRWEDGVGLFPETPITEGTPSTTIELDAPDQTDEPTVTPTPDGQPLTSPDPDVDCMSDYPEDTGFVGRVIFRSVACVVLWAFTPSPDTFTSWQQDVTTQVSTRAPVAYLAPGADFMTAIGEGAQQCFEWAAPISLNMFGPAVDASTSEPVPILSTCDPGPLESRMIELRPLFVVLMFSMFFVPLAWWGWRSYAPGTTSSA